MDNPSNNPMYSSFISAVSRHNFDQTSSIPAPQPNLMGGGGVVGFMPAPGMQQLGNVTPAIPTDLVSQMQKDASQFIRESEIKQQTPFFTSYLVIGISGLVFFILSFLLMNGMKLCVNSQNEKQLGKAIGLSFLLALILMVLQYMYKRVHY